MHRILVRRRPALLAEASAAPSGSLPSGGDAQAPAVALCPVWRDPGAAAARASPRGVLAARGARRACQASRSCQKVMRPALSEDTSGVPCGLHAVQSTLAAPASLSVATTAPARSACCARGAPAPAPRQPAAACAPGCVRWGMQGCQDNGLTLTCCHSGCNELKIRSFNTHIIPG